MSLENIIANLDTLYEILIIPGVLLVIIGGARVITEFLMIPINKIIDEL